MSLNILKNIKLADYTSWLIGGPAENYCAPTNIDELKEALHFAKSQKLAITLLGGGSNVLVADEGIKGLVIHLRKFSEIKSEIKNNKIYIEVLSGTSKSELLKLFLKNQLEPALFLAGLPGDVGGGVVMNAGVAELYKPREFMELVESIDVMTSEGEIKNIKKENLNIRYRHTDGWQPDIVIKAYMSWPYEQNAQVLTLVREANRTRLSKQPLDLPSCGSVFKNPEGYKAAQLIDQCGLKGLKMGEAQVSLKHANFIVNLGDATAIDTWNLILHVKKTVKEMKGVDLTTEVVLLGDWVD
jgi:UDP-N-acetylmuramate dehydrogenase